LASTAARAGPGSF